MLRSSGLGLFLAVLFRGSLAAIYGNREGGQLMREEKASSKDIAVSEQYSVNRNENDAGRESTVPVSGLSNADYVWGTVDTNNCDSRADTNTSELSETECASAAMEAGASQQVNPTIIASAIQNARPKDCYVYPCESHGIVKRACNFWNPIDVVSAQPLRGMPVCKRHRFLYGKAVANGQLGDSSLCVPADLTLGANYSGHAIHEQTGEKPPFVKRAEAANHGSVPASLNLDQEYWPVQTKLDCIAAAGAMGECRGEPFDLFNNLDVQNDHPPGCYLRWCEPPCTACVYWNNGGWTTNRASRTTTCGPSDGNCQKDKPICMVKSPDQVPSAVNETDTSNALWTAYFTAHRDTAAESTDSGR